MEKHRKASTAAVKSLNTDGRIIINQQHIADTFNSYFLSVVDSINVNNKSAHTYNKYNPNTVSNNSPLQSMSQSHKSTYT
jgi:ribosomal protein S9